MDKQKTGELIRRMRGLKKGYTHIELGDLIGVTNKAISRWEKRSFPIVKDTTPNMMNPRLYTTSYNKP